MSFGLFFIISEEDPKVGQGYYFTYWSKKAKNVDLEVLNIADS